MVPHRLTMPIRIKAGPVAVVHNGIIENYRELRAELAENGVGFVTDTDTETVALMTDSATCPKDCLPVDAAVYKTH